jgi:type IV secretion system protein VirB10
MAEAPVLPSSTPEPDRTPRVWRRFQLPPGVLPRYTQHAGLALLALLMVVIMLLTARPLQPTKPTSPPVSPLTDGQQTRIQDFQRRLQEEADRLAREQADLALAKQAFARTTPPPPPESWTAPQPSTATAVDSLEQERRQREERARFADNVAFRREAKAPTPVLTSTDAPAREKKAEEPSVRVPDGHHRLLEGTLVETVLTNRLDGTFAGPVNCLVTTPVYARDGETLLIPAGARFLGSVKPVTQMDQARLAVAFHRITFPNGDSVKLDLFPGLNQVGDTALRDQVNRHYWQTFGASAAVGALAGLSLAQTRYGLDTTGADVYRQGMATSFANSSTRILDRYLNQLPTVTIREGHPVIVYLTADLDLPAYRADASAISQEP